MTKYQITFSSLVHRVKIKFYMNSFKMNEEKIGAGKWLRNLGIVKINIGEI